MNVSQAVTSGSSSVTLEIDDRELRQYAGQVSGTLTDYQVKTFVGLATFMSADTFNNIPAYATQTAVNLARTGAPCLAVRDSFSLALQSMPCLSAAVVSKTPS
eukprot:454228-Hanusia_phi.AAC.1